MVMLWVMRVEKGLKQLHVPERYLEAVKQELGITE